MKDLLEKYIPVVLALSILKMPFGIKVYLNIIPVLIGLYYILKNKKIEKSFLALCLMLLMGFGVSLYHQDIKSIARLGQVLCMIGFATYLSEIKTFNLEKFLRYLFGISLIVFLIEFFFFKSPLPTRDFLGYEVSRYNGPVGEVNYSSIFLSLAGVLALFENRKRYYFLSCFILLFTYSRTGFLLLSFGLLLFLLNHYVHKAKLKFWFNNLVALTLFLAPVFIFLVDKNSSMEIKIWLEKASNGRFYLSVPYINMGFDNPLGIGYFRGWSNYAEYLAPIKSLVDSIRNSQINEQHSIFIQVFSEFGVAGYLIFISFLSLLFKKVRSLHGEAEISLLLCALAGYSLLNGLNDTILYLVFAYSLRTSPWQKQSDANRHP